MLVSSSLAQDLHSPVWGYNAVDCPAGSDTVVSIPFHRQETWAGELNGAPTEQVDGWDLPIAGTATLPADALVGEPHYLRIDGIAAVFSVISNGSDLIRIDLSELDLSNLAAGTAVRAIPHWTLASVWPPDGQQSLHPSTSKLLSGRGSMVLFADTTTSGIDLAPNRAYFLTGEGWFHAALGFPASDSTVIPPGQSLVIRHQQGAGDTVFHTHNLVQRDSQRILLNTSKTGPSDNHLGIPRPIPVALMDLDLGPTVFLDSASTDPADRKDELMLYDNSDVSQNKVPARVFFRVGGIWHEDDGATYPVSDDYEIEPSSGIILRKSATLDGQPVLWVNSPRY